MAVHITDEYVHTPPTVINIPPAKPVVEASDVNFAIPCLSFPHILLARQYLVKASLITVLQEPIYGIAGGFGDEDASAMKTYQTVKESEMAALMENLPDRPQDVGCWDGFKRSQHRKVCLHEDNQLHSRNVLQHVQQHS